MNNFQQRWWEQARSDIEIFRLLQKHNAAQCHLLHYLQMGTEKLAKAYLWRSGKIPPKKTHSGFVNFLKFLGQIQERHRDRVAAVFSFYRFSDFQKWIRTVSPLAYELQRLAPDLANDGPNPEYPWPHHQPMFSPATHQFPLARKLMTGQGRDLTRVIHIAVDRFPEYADV